MGTKSCTKILYKNLEFFDKIFVRIFCRRRFRNSLYEEKILLIGKCFKRKIWTHLDLLSKNSNYSLNS